MKSAKPSVIDLFCGCGGMSWGLEKSGFTTLCGIDNDPKALRTFSENHPHSLSIEADMDDLAPKGLMHKLGLQPGELDCLVGGPPCQGFSKNVPASERFLDDPRNQLFKSFLNFVDTIRPKTVVMENVEPIYNAYGGSVRAQVVDWLESNGYEVVVKVLHAPDYGVPQRRRRCFFFASSTGLKPKFPEPSHFPDSELTLFESKKHYVSAWEAIHDLPVLSNGEGSNVMEYDCEPRNEYQVHMRRDSIVLADHKAKDLKDKQLRRVMSIGPGQGYKDLPKDLQPKSGYSGAYGRLDFESVAPTITRWVFHPGSGRFCHPSEPRLITIREAARIQGFSDDFVFTGTYINKAHQVGNAVPPLLMEKLAEEISACLPLAVTA